MANNDVKTCPHDCTRCTMMQQILCAAQFSRMNAESMRNLEERLELMDDKLKKLVGDNGGVFNPMADEEEEAMPQKPQKTKTAQGDGGAEE